MDDFLEKVKDFLYHFFDYIFIGLVVIFIGLIINWRLNILFNNNDVSRDINANISKIEAEKNKDKLESTNKSESDDNSSDKNDKMITIDIPKGSVSSDIGQILEDAELIESYSKFDDKVYELDLAESLKPGEFEFEMGTSLEEIIIEISK